MLTYPHIDPVALSLGPLKIHWYGLMYLVGFLAAWWLGRRRARQPNSGWTDVMVSDLIFYAALGVVLGGRIGYILFYDFSAFLDHPLLLVKIWQGGMSFHGGLLGVITAMWLFARRHGQTFFQIADFTAPLVPIGLGAGRIGNFINGELPGRVTEVPWGMVYPHIDQFARHPSQLYQAATEGLVLFIVLWWYSSAARPRAAVSGLFLLGYGVLRFSTEFTRQPDAHLGFIAFDWMTMGQALSTPMIMIGAGMMAWAYRKREA
ncbi:MAG: prolipoprotein diacylglyceryl transferase [Pseudomonadota bacterium]